MKMRILILFSMLVLIAIAITHQRKQDDVIELGLIGCLTGPHSQVGTASRNAARMAVNECNESGGIHGKKVVLHIRDNQENIDTAIAVTRNLLDSFNIPLIFGHNLSSMVPAVTTFRDSNVLFISSTMSSSELSVKDDNFVRFIAPTSEQARVLYDEIKCLSGISKIATVIDNLNRQYTNDVYTHLVKLVDNDEVITIASALSFNSSELNELDSVADEIVGQNPDLIVVISSGVDFAVMAQLIRKKGSKAQLCGSRWAGTQDVIQHGGKTVEGAFFVQDPPLVEKSPELRAFENKYNELYGSIPGFIPRFSYESVHHTLEIIKTLDTISPVTVRDALIQKRNFDGLVSPMKMDSLGDMYRINGVVYIRNGEFVVQER